jgi:hypothetical protein
MPGSAAIFGLWLHEERERAGAVVAFRDRELLAAAGRFRREAPDPLRAMAQAERLMDLAALQDRALDSVAHALEQAAGLPMLAHAESAGLPHGIALRVPNEVDAATFYAYVLAEQTPIVWLSALQPVHHLALRDPAGAAAARELARWLLVPVGPGYSEEEISHAVLGVVKTADYLGARWRTNPARAAAYAAEMDRMYGPGHEAYRPAFPIPAEAVA